jgi:RNA polymerase sigma-70 factor (ECF subfamily)
MLRKRFGQGFEAEADDVVQETYVRIAPYRDAAPIRRPQALLMRVASNLARDLLRRRGVRGRHAQEVASGPDPVGLAIDDPMQNLLVKDVILSIPEAYRDVFILSRFGGLTYEEIATRCNLSIKSVEWRLGKAVAHCTKRVQD